MGVAMIDSVFSSILGLRVRAALTPYLSHGLAKSELNMAARLTPAAQATVSHFPASFRPARNAQVAKAFMDGLHRGCSVAARHW